MPFHLYPGYALPLSPSLLVPLFFFFHYRAHPRDLHSFPYTTLFRSAIRARALAVRRARSCPRAWGTRDRKSTRLNSSHITISYAVFCLKKKKKGVTN